MFFGAGPSAAAGLPTWARLLADLATAADMDASALAELDLRDQAALIADALGPGQLNEELSKRLSAQRFSLLHALMANLPSREFVTTNLRYRRGATSGDL